MAQGGGVIGKPGGLVEPGVKYYAKKIKTLGGIDYDILEKIIKKANTGNKFFTEEQISKAYAEATGQTNVTKRKITTTKETTVVTYKKLNTPEIHSKNKAKITNARNTLTGDR